MKTTDEKLFFRGRYSYRRPGVLIASFFLLTFCFFTTRLSLQILTDGASPKSAGNAAFIGAIAGLCAFLGIFFLLRWFGRKHIELEITPAGISYGKTFHPWEKIRWVAGHSGESRITLFYQTHSMSFDRHLILDESPAPAEYHQLMETLRTELQGKHPGIVFG